MSFQERNLCHEFDLELTYSPKLKNEARHDTNYIDKKIKAFVKCY